MNWLLVIFIILIIVGLGLGVYGGIEKFKHNSTADSHTVFLYIGIALFVIGIIGAIATAIISSRKKKNIMMQGTPIGGPPVIYGPDPMGVPPMNYGPPPPMGPPMNYGPPPPVQPPMGPPPVQNTQLQQILQQLQNMQQSTTKDSCNTNACNPCNPMMMGFNPMMYNPMAYHHGHEMNPGMPWNMPSFKVKCNSEKSD